MSHSFKSLLSFEDVAAALNCTDETVRMLVVEDRSLPAVYVTHVGYKEPYGEHSMFRIGALGTVWDWSGPEDHTGYLRVERAALDAFAAEQQVSLVQAAKDASAATKERTYLNIVASMLELMMSPRSGRDSQAAVIAELVENYPDRPGVSKATLEKVFAAARRASKP